ncbi:hypothetical protein B0H15DRAFT_870340 [Mycena belliarum]|uniref:Uncharacterized protein n=1 Tax=Mycena belliarum TaxID=1033014 RepID=A0AAD6XLD7_9AGAR|nr:hypothetical protein B0H15DRAFT_870340 [Mycena belliae]
MWTACRVFTFKRLVFASLLLISPMIWRLLWRNRPAALRPDRRYQKYNNADEEDRYWETAELHGRRLRSSDARFAGSECIRKKGFPVVTSYSPALLPYYRQGSKKVPRRYHLSLRSLCKWHRMVFPGPWHPTVSEASRLREKFSAEDLREIHRISRMVPDGKVFGRSAQRWKPKYREIWRKWLEGDRGVQLFFE